MIVSLLCLLLAQAEEPVADVVFRDATVVDGSGKESFRGDVALCGETLLEVREWKGRAKQIVDARGLVVAPGFIDLHSHSDLGDAILREGLRHNGNFTSQGCATVVTGNCGAGVLEAGRLFEGIEKHGAGTNVIQLVPHGEIRRRVLGHADRVPTADELDRMKALVEEAMQAGAWGMSTGLWYVPASYSKTQEIVELARVAARHGGMYFSHVRNEAGGVVEAVREAIDIGERSGCPVQISHLKCSSREAWGKMEEVCRLMEEARARGLKVAADQYPYPALSSGLIAFTVPGWAREGGRKKFLERLDDPELGPKIRREIAEGFEKRDAPDRYRILRYPPKQEYVGKTVADIAREKRVDPVEVVLEIARAGEAEMVAFSMREEDLLLAMKKDYVATGSDGATRAGSATGFHPRSFGTFPRKIGRYALQQKAVSLEFAIRSSSGLAADILGLRDRGYLRPGYKADVVVFDPETFRDHATYEEPGRPSTGVRWLYVNGVAVIAEGKPTGALPGKPLRRNR